MIRRRCPGCGGSRYHVHTAEAEPERYQWGPHAAAASCAGCGRSLGWLKAPEALLLLHGVLPAAAERFKTECGPWVEIKAAAWAAAALERGVPGSPPIETARDLVRALEVACALPAARRRAPKLCRRLAYAIGACRREAEVWAAVVMVEGGLVEVVADTMVELPFGETA